MKRFYEVRLKGKSLMWNGMSGWYSSRTQAAEALVAGRVACDYGFGSCFAPEKEHLKNWCIVPVEVHEGDPIEIEDALLAVAKSESMDIPKPA